MSRNLLRTDCYFCPADKVVVAGPYTVFQAKYPQSGYRAQYDNMIVADAECLLCGAQYLAWIDERPCGQPRASRYRDHPSELSYFDLSFRSTFNDEPGPEDLPVYLVVEERKSIRKGPWTVCGYTNDPAAHAMDSYYADCRWCKEATAWRLANPDEINRRKARLAWSDWTPEDIAQEVAPWAKDEHRHINLEAEVIRLTNERERLIYWLCQADAVFDYMYEYGDPRAVADLARAPNGARVRAIDALLTELGYDDKRRDQMITLGEPGKTPR